MMKHREKGACHEALERLHHLPRKMLSLHGIDNLTEYVLHDLCHSGCSTVGRAAYFVDNPQFDMLKGVAGYAKGECYRDLGQSWQDHVGSFDNHMRQAPFNQKVRSVCSKSLKAQEEQRSLAESVKDLAQALNFEDVSFTVWNLKYDNSGVLLFEQEEDDSCEHFVESLHLLGFCPVF